MWKVKRMNTARIVVLDHRLGAAALPRISPAVRDNAAPAQPVAQLPTVEVSSPNRRSASASRSSRRSAMADLAGRDRRHSFISRPARPTPSRRSRLDRALAVHRGEPIREQKLVKADGSGFMAAILPAGYRAISTEIRRRPAPAASSCRTTAST
jgi:pilus assembly protein CpaB